jgi:hypothetical protein
MEQVIASVASDAQFWKHDHGSLLVVRLADAFDYLVCVVAGVGDFHLWASRSKSVETVCGNVGHNESLVENDVWNAVNVDWVRRRFMTRFVAMMLSSIVASILLSAFLVEDASSQIIHARPKPNGQSHEQNNQEAKHGIKYSHN